MTEEQQLNDAEFLQKISSLQNSDCSNVGKELSKRCLCNWVSFIHDDVKVFDLMIPGSHNSTSYSMREMHFRLFPNLPDLFAKCQELNLISQLLCGIRYLDLRVTIKEGELIFCHGKVSGRGVEKIIVEQLKAFSDSFPGEIIILDFQKFMVPEAVPRTAELLEKALNISENALKLQEFAGVTLGLLRRKRYKYIVIWGAEEINRDWQLPRNHSLVSPYKNKVSFSHAKKIISYVEKHLGKSNQSQFFCAQFIFRPIISSPYRIEVRHGHHFSKWINSLTKDCKGNIIQRDFIDRCPDNIGRLMRLNMEKGFIKENRKKAFGLLVETQDLNKSESETYCRKKMRKNYEEKRAEFEIGIPDYPGSIPLQRHKQAHSNRPNLFKRIFRGCAKRIRNREQILLSCPDGYVVSFVGVYLENLLPTETAKDIEITVLKGWLLENAIELELKNSKTAERSLVVKAEAVALTSGIFRA